MNLTITAAQRDALYDQIIDRLSGIEDVWLSVCGENFEAAKRLAVEFSDDLRLVSEDLGWGDGQGSSIALRTPPDVLDRALSRLGKAAEDREAGEQEERVEVREAQERNHLVAEACRSVLAALDRGDTKGK